MLRAPVTPCSLATLAALLDLLRFLSFCSRSYLGAVLASARDAPNDPTSKPLSGGAERTREASSERLACWFDALAALAALALLLLLLLAL